MKAQLAQLISGEVSYVLAGRNVLPEKAVILPGSFNPLHKGHEGLLCAAEEVTGRPGLLEMSVINVDKPPLTIEEVERRLLQFKDRYAVLLTCASTFEEKASLFPGLWFALGYDTAIRLLSPAYHDNVPAMLAGLRSVGTRFAVAGRLHKGEYQGLESMDVPQGYDDLFVPIPERLFREDISSTQLRNER